MKSIKMPNNNSARCVIVFLKVPQKSKVKTRLSKFLDPEIVVDIYKNFVADILGMLNRSPYRIIVGYYPPHAQPEAVEWLGPGYTLMPQLGNNLGKRMANAFDKIFSKGYQRALLLGTDFPDLPESIVDEAFKSLDHNDAVIGPAVDGGYYLIGFKSDSYLPEAFDGIPWGTENVFEKTMKVFRKHGLKIHALPKWRDIDTYEDLKFFINTYAQKQSTALNTAAYLSNIELDTNTSEAIE